MSTLLDADDVAGAALATLSPAELDEATLRKLAERLRRYLFDAEPVCALLTPLQAAERARVHVETVRRAARSGVLPASHAGRAVRIAQADLDAWLARAQGATTSTAHARGRKTTPRRPLADAINRQGDEPS